MSTYAMIELDESGHQPLPNQFDPDDQGLVYGQNLGQCGGIDQLNAIAEAAGVEPIENYFDDDLDAEEMEEFGLDPDDIDENWSPIEDGIATLKVLIAELEKRPNDSTIGRYPTEAVLWDLRVGLAILENASSSDEMFRYVVG